jgi:hypothetical protein
MDDLQAHFQVALIPLAIDIYSGARVDSLVCVVVDARGQLIDKCSPIESAGLIFLLIRQTGFIGVHVSPLEQLVK